MKTKLFLLLLLLSFLYIHIVTKSGQYEINTNDIKSIITNPDNSDKKAILVSVLLIIFLVFIYTLFHICPSNVTIKPKINKDKDIKSKDNFQFTVTPERSCCNGIYKNKEHINECNKLDISKKCCRAPGLYNGKPYNFEYTPDTDDYWVNQRF